MTPTDPRKTRLDWEFTQVQQMLERNPNRLFELYCAKFTTGGEISIGLMERTVRMDAILKDLGNFMTADDFRKRYKNEAPDQYLIVYRCNTLLMRQQDTAPDLAEDTEVGLEIIYGIDYPSQLPTFVMLGNPAAWKDYELFHPNIRTPHICLEGRRPFPIGMALVEIIPLIGKMLQYQNYNDADPLNRVAAQWIREHKADLPIDTRDIMDRNRQTRSNVIDFEHLPRDVMADVIIFEDSIEEPTDDFDN